MTQNSTFWGVLLVGAPIVVGLVVWVLCQRYYCIQMDKRYLEGVQDGQKMETNYAVERAVEAYRLSLQRRLTDSGRRAVPRPDAQPSRIHKLRVGPPMPKRPNSQD